jgi:hypothetical protein
MPRESVDEGPQEVIKLVDVTVTVFPPVRVLFEQVVFSEPVPPVPRESKDAFVAIFEDVVKFADVLSVASSSWDTGVPRYEDVSGSADVPLVTVESKGAFEGPIAVFTLFRVLFAYGVLSEPVPPVASESREAFDAALEDVYEYEDAVLVSTFSSPSTVAI